MSAPGREASPFGWTRSQIPSTDAAIQRDGCRRSLAIDRGDRPAVGADRRRTGARLCPGRRPAPDRSAEAARLRDRPRPARGHGRPRGAGCGRSARTCIRAELTVAAAVGADGRIRGTDETEAGRGGYWRKLRHTDQRQRREWSGSRRQPCGARTRHNPATKSAAPRPSPSLPEETKDAARAD